MVKILKVNNNVQSALEIRNICTDAIGGDRISGRAKIANPLITLIAPDEEFRDITNREINGVYENFYMISNYGRAYSKWVYRIMSPGVNKAGYEFIMASTISGPKPSAIHRLVLKTFKYIPGCEELEVNHIDGNKHNNKLSNLEWVTRSENVIHSYEIGIHKKGSNSPISKIDENTARRICELLATNSYTNEEIANIVGNNTAISIVSSIKNGCSWKDISDEYNFYRRPGRLFTDNDIRILCEYFVKNPKPDYLTVNDHCRQALLSCGYDNSDRYVDTIRKIYSRKYSTNISKDYDF